MVHRGAIKGLRLLWIGLGARDASFAAETAA